MTVCCPLLLMCKIGKWRFSAYGRASFSVAMIQILTGRAPVSSCRVSCSFVRGVLEMSNRCFETAVAPVGIGPEAGPPFWKGALHPACNLQDKGII